MGPIKYTREVVKEGRRIRWPKREDLVKTVIVVVVIAAFAALFLSLDDWAAGSMITQLRNAFGGK